MFILLIAGWIVFDYFHYFPPDIDKDKIARLAEAELKKQSASLLQNSYNPNLTKKLASIKILDVKDVHNRTYVVFKMDYTLQGPEQVMPYGFKTDNYILGLRLVEKELGGISLKDGMEFESNYLSAGPADCGLDSDGNFYAFCKDPRVMRVVLETDDGKKIQTKLEKRVVLVRVPSNSQEIRPHFYSANGDEIELFSNFRVAFLSNEEKYYQQYANTPLEWWLLGGKDIGYLTADSIDALWVFPDQQQGALQGESVAKLKELAQEGIPLIFIGMKDVNTLAQAFKVDQVGRESAAGTDIEALYVGKHPDGRLNIGVIGLDDSESFPVVQKSVALRYQIENYRMGKNVKAIPSTVDKPVKATVKGVTI